jgi:D-alanyl-lipoteichoic acid acyltransferase DltB (MBOAT superfamily)
MSLLLLGMVFLNQFIGKKIYILQRKEFLVAGISINLLVLGFFKYTIFLLEASQDIFHLLGLQIQVPIPMILLPVGISFYTFHNISYLVDIWNRKISPAKSMINFAVYDLFFPLLLAGPIERPASLIPQIENDRKVEPEEFTHGMYLFFWGLFKKIYIADNLNGFVEESLKMNLEPGMIHWIAFAFAFQIYADFSGYTDSARGMAKMMGFRLMINFNLPLFSVSVGEFWRRWHISLSSWLRDYIYIPLGGNRFGAWIQNRNIIIVWTLGGLWHGATYGYLLWGFYCGTWIVLYNIWSGNILKKIPENILDQNLIGWFIKSLGWILTFASFSYGLLLFSVESPEDLSRLIRNAKSFYWGESVFLIIFKYTLILLPLFIGDIWQKFRKEDEPLLGLVKRPILGGVLLIIGFFLVSLFGIFEQKEFFYFQF